MEPKKHKTKRTGDVFKTTMAAVVSDYISYDRETNTLEADQSTITSVKTLERKKNEIEDVVANINGLKLSIKLLKTGQNSDDYPNPTGQIAYWHEEIERLTAKLTQMIAIISLKDGEELEWL